MFRFGKFGSHRNETNQSTEISVISVRFGRPLHSWLLAIQTFDHLAIRTSSHMTIQTYGLLVIQTYGLLAIQTSGHLSQNFPDWEIFSLPWRLHQSQIPNVLPGHSSGRFSGLTFITFATRNSGCISTQINTYPFTWIASVVCLILDQTINLLSETMGQFLNTHISAQYNFSPLTHSLPL